MLRTDPGASVTLLAGQQLTVDGTIDTPGGKIAIGLTPGASDVLYSDSRSIWFGKNARLSARGTDELLYDDGSGVTQGEVLDGGTIQIGRVEDNGSLNPANGYVVAEQGASFDVSGAVSDPVVFQYGRFLTAPQRVASAGGSIDIRAREGLLFAGTLKGAAGGCRRPGWIPVDRPRPRKPHAGRLPERAQRAHALGRPAGGRDSAGPGAGTADSRQGRQGAACHRIVQRWRLRPHQSAQPG